MAIIHLFCCWLCMYGADTCHIYVRFKMWSKSTVREKKRRKKGRAEVAVVLECVWRHEEGGTRGACHAGESFRMEVELSWRRERRRRRGWRKSVDASTPASMVVAATIKFFSTAEKAVGTFPLLISWRTVHYLSGLFLILQQYIRVFIHWKTPAMRKEKFVIDAFFTVPFWWSLRTPLFFSTLSSTSKPEYSPNIALWGLSTLI